MRYKSEQMFVRTVVIKQDGDGVNSTTSHQYQEDARQDLRVIVRHTCHVASSKSVNGN
jgi:hypothetical protein